MTVPPQGLRELFPPVLRGIFCHRQNHSEPFSLALVHTTKGTDRQLQSVPIITMKSKWHPYIGANQNGSQWYFFLLKNARSPAAAAVAAEGAASVWSAVSTEPDFVTFLLWDFRLVPLLLLPPDFFAFAEELAPEAGVFFTPALPE